MPTVGVETVANLSRQFARGAQYQYPTALRPRLASIGEDAVQDGQRKGCGFSGTCLGNADDVTTGQCDGNGLSLDGRGRQIILFFKRTRNGIGEAEILKGGQKGVLSM